MRRVSPRKRARLWAWAYTATVGGDDGETDEPTESPRETGKRTESTSSSEATEEE